jgi:dihydroneopterin aldolase/2-amino-4-hydroxy-6-hydroxymethyldihydropteridine diphosphokinase
MDEIIIDKLRVFCKHGVYADEQTNGQNFYVSARIFMETYIAGITDDLENTVNYAGMCHLISDYMQDTRYNLIEAVAENLAAYILNFSPIIKGVELSISKPEAPVDLPFEDIRVKVSRQWKRAYIAFGSNVGDKEKHIQNAIEKIGDNNAIRIVKISPIMTSKPYGNADQDDFLNGCMLVETFMRPEFLLNFLNQIELEEGRVRAEHWGPRTLDLDIVFYEEEIIHTDRLVVPHIDMHNREFVLQPLCEIAPYAYHPIFKKTVQQLLFDYRNR